MRRIILFTKIVPLFVALLLALSATSVSAQGVDPAAKITPFNNQWVLSNGGVMFSLHPYDKLEWVEEKQMYYGSVGGYSTYIYLDGREMTPIAQRAFAAACDMPDSDMLKKIEKYNAVILIDLLNKEGYVAKALVGIGDVYANTGYKDAAAGVYDAAAKMGDITAKNKADAVRSTPALAQTVVQPVSTAQPLSVAQPEVVDESPDVLTQIGNLFSSMSATLQQNSGSGNVNSYNSNSYNRSSSSGGSRTKVEKHCTKCAGWGTCAKCGGDGYVLGKFSQEFEPCSSCNYKGRTPKSKQGKCTYCGGTGKR